MIKTEKILYIKLGGGGKFEQECIKKNKTIKLGYKEQSHEDCINGNWEKLRPTLRTDKPDEGVVTRHINQIKQFYTEPESTMWVTFHKGYLWYCFVSKEIIFNEDKTKERRTIDGWKNTDINGNLLLLQNLSGRLTKVQAFQGTICNIWEKKYLINKINCEQSRQLQAVDDSLSLLQLNIINLIKKLSPKDFELFVDLIFRESGWSRNGSMGKNIKDIDIDISSPATFERAAIQIKSESGLKLFKKVKEKILLYDFYDKYFFVTHTPSKELKKYINSKEENDIIIYDAEKLAELCIDSGLVKWLISISD